MKLWMKLIPFYPYEEGFMHIFTNINIIWGVKLCKRRLLKMQDFVLEYEKQ